MTRRHLSRILPGLAGGRIIDTAYSYQTAFRAAVAATLEELRHDREWREVAVQLQVDPTTLSKLIHGRRGISDDLLTQFDALAPGFLLTVFKRYASIRKQGVNLAGRTRAARDRTGAALANGS